MIFCKYMQITRKNHDAKKIDKSFYEIKVKKDDFLFLIDKIL